MSSVDASLHLSSHSATPDSEHLQILLQPLSLDLDFHTEPGLQVTVEEVEEDEEEEEVEVDVAMAAAACARCRSSWASLSYSSEEV